MPTPIESAVIEIIADTSGFADSLVPDVRKAVDRAVDIVGTGFASVDQTIKEAFDFSGIDVSDINEVANAVRGLEARLTALRDENDQPLLDANQVREAVGVMERSLASLENTIVSGPQQALRNFDEIAERAGERVRAALGRTAVRGVEQLDASLEDLENTIGNEIRVATDSARTALQELAKVPGLEFLEGQIDNIAFALRKEIGGAATDALTEMKRFGDVGVESTQDLIEIISRVSGRFDDSVESVNDLRNVLRRLSGDSRVFDEMVQDMDRFQRETSQSVVETLQLRDAQERVQDETRQTATAARLAATSFERLDRNRLRSLIAGLNRARFVALDLRFIVTGLGLALAGRFARFGVEAASSLEQLRLSLSAIAASIDGTGKSFTEFSDEAELSFNRIVAVARETPFAIDEVAEATRRIAAFIPSFGVLEEGVDNLNVRTTAAVDIFQTLGGTLALLGNTEGLNRVVKALGDIGARGRLTGEEIRQLANALPGIDLRETIVKGLSAGVKGFEDLQREMSLTNITLPEAVERFNQLQEAGLVPAEAAIQGLLGGLNEIFDTKQALQAFTTTIEGSMEKIKEAAQIGSGEGLRPLAEVLVEVLPDALVLVEGASRRFGEGITELARGAIPLFLDGASQMADLLGNATEAIGDFLQENQADLLGFGRSFFKIAEAIGGFVGEIVDDLLPAFIDITDFIAETAIGFRDLARIAGPAIEAIANPIGDLARVLNQLPDEIQAIGFVATIVFVRTVSRALKLVRADAAAANTQLTFMSTAMGTARRSALLLRNALRTTLIFAAIEVGITLFTKLADAISGANPALDDFRENLESQGFVDFGDFDPATSSLKQLEQALIEADGPLEQFRDTFDQLGAELAASESRVFNTGNLSDLIEEVQKLEKAQANVNVTTDAGQRFLDNLEATREEMRRTAEEFGFTGRSANELETELANLGAEVDITRQEWQKHLEIFRIVERTFQTLPTTLSGMSDAFNASRVAANLTTDDIEALANTLGINLTLPTETVIQRFDEAINKAGGLGQAFEAAGVDTSKFGKIIVEQTDEVEDLIGTFNDAVAAIQGFADAQRAQADPIFAIIDAMQGFEEANAALSETVNKNADDFANEEERLSERTKAALDAAKAELDLRDAVAGLGQAVADGVIDLTRGEELFGDLLAGFSESGEAIDIIGDEFDKLPKIIQDSLDRSGALAGEGVGGFMQDAFQNGLPAALPDVEKEIEKFAGETLKSFTGAFSQEDLDTAFEEAFAGGKLAKSFRGAFSQEDLQAGIVDASTFQQAAQEIQTVTDGILTETEEKFRLAGSDAGQGFSEGLNQTRPIIQSTVQGIASLSINTLRSHLGISSPSRITRGFGHDFIDGFILGINDRRQALQAALTLTPQAGTALQSGAGGLGGGGGFNVNIGNITSPSPEEAASVIVSDLDNYVYLNGGKLIPA